MKDITKITILSGLFLFVLYFGTFKWLFDAWINDSYYSHGFLVLGISIFVAWTKRNEFKVEPYKNGVVLIVMGLILYVIGFIELFPFLSAISFLFTLCGMILYLYGKDTMRALAFPISFLIFAIPLPFLINIASVLQTISAKYSTMIIEILGISVTRIGSEIHLQNSSFVVGLPCSGMNTLISLLTLSTIFIYILSCPTYKKAILFCITIPIAIFSNILRITMILSIANAHGAEVAIRFFHDFSSLFVYIIAFVCLIIIGKLMGCNIKKS